MRHTGAALLGLAAFLLAALAIGETYGYISSTLLGGLTPASLGLFVVLATISAVGVYVVEDRTEPPARFGGFR